MKLLQMNHVKKSFNDETLHVLKDISLSVEKGEVVAIIGPSGSGKSTLLRCATLLTEMDSGELIYGDIQAVHNDEDGKAKDGKITKKRKGYTVQRYKGLGEMDPKQLASTTMDPKTRILQRVSIEDAVVADRAVRELMGSEVGYRREYIEKHAHDARFLDA